MNSRFCVVTSVISGVAGFLLLHFVCSPLIAKDYLAQDSILDAIPGTTKLVFACKNVRDTHADLAKTDLCKQFAGPVWQGTIKKQSQSQTASLLNPYPWLGLEWEDLSLLDCEAVFVGFEDDTGTVCTVLFAKLGPKAVENPFVKRWLSNQNGQRLFEVTKPIASVEMHIATSSKTKKQIGCMAIGTQWTCISGTPDAVARWLAATPNQPMGQTPASLGSIKTSIAMDKTTGLSYWMEPWSVLLGLMEKNEPKFIQSAKRFGLEGFKQAHGSIKPPGKGEAKWKVEYHLVLDKPLVRGMSMFSLLAGDKIIVPPVLSGVTDNVNIMFVDIKPWFQGVNHVVDQLIDEETPGSFGDLLDSILSDPEGPKIDIRKELIYRMGPLALSGGVTVPNVSPNGKTTRNQIWAFSLQDAGQAAKVLEKLFQGDEDVQSTRIGAFQCWHTNNDESLFVSLSKGESQTICIAAIDAKFLYLATDTKWFQGVLADTNAGKVSPSPIVEQMKKSGEQTFSFLQVIEMASWLQASWERMPEHPKTGSKGAEVPTLDPLAVLLTWALVPDSKVEDVPKWQTVKTAFGRVIHRVLRKDNELHGSLEMQMNGPE